MGVSQPLFRGSLFFKLGNHLASHRQHTGLCEARGSSRTQLCSTGKLLTQLTPQFLTITAGFRDPR